jgi:hypothetical protein
MMPLRRLGQVRFDEGVVIYAKRDPSLIREAIGSKNLSWERQSAGSPRLR